MTRALIFLVCSPLLGGCRVDHVIAELTDGGSGGLSDSSSAGATSTSAADSGSGETGSGCAFDQAPACEGVNDPWRAIGLGCEGTPISGQTVDESEPSAYRVVRQFGNAYWTAREGAQLLALTTGSLPIPDANGDVYMTAGASQPGADNEGQNGDELPPPIEPFDGSDVPWVSCDGVNDCSHSLVEIWTNGTAADLFSMAFSATAPAGAAGFALDVAWFSAEFPERAETPDGDLAVIWVSSEAFTGNLATVDGQALTAATVRSQVVEGKLVGDHPSLQATGFEGVEGPSCDHGWAVYTSCPRAGALDWMTLRGPASPGETVAVTIALMDRWDALNDTALLLDAWRWSCEACALGESCGLAPAL